MRQKEIAEDVINFLLGIPEIKCCNISGSLLNGDFDEYSDIDLEIEISGVDNGVFVTKLPALFRQKYKISFVNFAVSLVPEVYLVSMGLSNESPFMFVDITCTASPHIQTMQKEDFSLLNNLIDHTILVLIINLKHFIRGEDCNASIKKMHDRLFTAIESKDEFTMLKETFEWLKDNAPIKYCQYMDGLSGYF